MTSISPPLHRPPPPSLRLVRHVPQLCLYANPVWDGRIGLAPTCIHAQCAVPTSSMRGIEVSETQGWLWPGSGTWLASSWRLGFAGMVMS